MARRLIIPCPAKVNLWLKIAPPDRSGFHPLTTEFQAISLFDELTLTEDEDGIRVDGMELPPDNTLTKTLRLMHEVATLPRFSIHLKKAIPAQAGLGGGSSDAAGLIRGLRQWLPRTVPARDFTGVAKSVGADVPFFLMGGRAYGEGYGDRLSELPDKPTEWLVLAMPGEGCSTPKMYGDLDRAREEGRTFTQDGWRINDFHVVAPETCLKAIEALSEAGLQDVGMTGSGAAVFGIAESEDSAHQIARRLHLPWVAVARTLTRQESLKTEAQ